MKKPMIFDVSYVLVFLFFLFLVCFVQDLPAQKHFKFSYLDRNWLLGIFCGHIKGVDERVLACHVVLGTFIFLLILPSFLKLLSLQPGDL